MIKQRLFTPGPTDVPPEVLVEMAKPIFHHRTSRFKEMFAAVNDGLKKLLFTTGDAQWWGWERLTAHPTRKYVWYWPRMSVQPW